MSWTAIILSIGMMSGLLLYSSSLIKKSEMLGIKLFLFALGVINALILGTITWVISNNPTTPAAFLPISLGYLSINGVSLIIFIWFFGLGNIIDGFKSGDGGD